MGTFPDRSLTPARAEVLSALTGVVLPLLSEEQRREVTGLVCERVLSAPVQVAEDLTRAIDVLGSGAAGLLVAGVSRRFARLAPARRHQVLERWAASSIPQARSVYQALRRLVLTTWYATEGGRHDVGVMPPLHTRSPLVGWEGPLSGDRTLDSEPVSRRRRATADPAFQQASVPEAVVMPASLPGEVRLKADVVVIGSGAGGAVAACRFAEAGRQVVVLEEGEYLHAPDFNELERDLVPRLFADQAMRATVDASITLLQGGAAGGGTTVNWMLMLRPPADVLDEWERDLGIPGLPAGDLGPHLDRIEQEVHSRLVPHDAHSPSNSAILAGAQALGWRARPASINARDCVRAGTCSLGCRYDAKQSALLTFLPRAFARGARLYTGASVDRVEVLERATQGPVPPVKRVTAIVRDPRTGAARSRLVVDAPVVILAAGAVGTPVILQRSGLGGGGVGRYLRLHPTTVVMGHYAEATYPLAGIPQSALCDEFLRRDRHGYGFWIECPALLPALAAAALPGFGEAHRNAMGKLRNTVAFIVLVRDGSGTRKSSGSVWIDGRGRTRIRYRLTPADRDNLRLGIEAAARLHLAAGATEALSLHEPPVRARVATELGAMRAAPVAPNRVALFSAHVNGTCRLGVNPATSGCSPTGERHGVPGLYVMDGSLLPTAPGVNPQEMIMAIASLLAERAVR